MLLVGAHSKRAIKEQSALFVYTRKTVVHLVATKCTPASEELQVGLFYRYNIWKHLMKPKGQKNHNKILN